MVLSDTESGTELLNGNSDTGNPASSTLSDLVSIDVKSDSIHLDVTEMSLSGSSDKSVPLEPGSDITQGGTTSPQNGITQKFIHVPDLFSSIMAIDPCVNPNYHKVKPKADSWITSVLREDSKWDARNSKVDFTFMASIWAPYCDEEALRTMVDWLHWIFLFDDQFDEGYLSKDPVLAQEEIHRTMDIMEDTRPPVQAEDDAMRFVFQTTWDRLKKRSSQDLQQRWKDMHRVYFDGLLEQVNVMHDQRLFTRGVQEYMNMRRRTIGQYPAIPLTEYALGIKLPQTVVDHPSIQECMCVSADLTLLANDVYSYRKDLEQNVGHNLILLLQGQGLSAQKAVDQIGTMIDDCYKRWYTALVSMPVWGEEIDREVLRFIDVCRNVPLGNLHWGFKSGRYMGAEGQQIRETRILRLP